MGWGDEHSAAELAAAARAGGFSGAEVPLAVAIALAESGGEMVINRKLGETPASRRNIERCASFGPWQINYCPGRDAGTARERAAKTPDLKLHAQIAYSIYREQGWRAWTQYRDGVHKRFMQTAEAAASSSAGDTTRKGVRRVGEAATDIVGDAAGDAAAAAGGALVPGLAVWRALLGTGDDDGASIRLALGQLVLGAFLLIVGIVLLLRDVAPGVAEVALAGATGGGSVAADLVT